VEELLRTVPGAVALHHDLGDAAATGSVARTVRDAEGVMDSGETPLVNDCACCALREDLVPELLRLAEVSARQQRQLARAVKNAREMALLPYAAR
jgi:hypothetical protein